MQNLYSTCAKKNNLTYFIRSANHCIRIITNKVHWSKYKPNQGYYLTSKNVTDSNKKETCKYFLCFICPLTIQSAIRMSKNIRCRNSSKSNKKLFFNYWECHSHSLCIENQQLYGVPINYVKNSKPLQQITCNEPLNCLC